MDIWVQNSWISALGLNSEHCHYEAGVLATGWQCLVCAEWTSPAETGDWLTCAVMSRCIIILKHVQKLTIKLYNYLIVLLLRLTYFCQHFLCFVFEGTNVSQPSTEASVLQTQPTARNSEIIFSAK